MTKSKSVLTTILALTLLPLFFTLLYWLMTAFYLWVEDLNIVLLIVLLFAFWIVTLMLRNLWWPITYAIEAIAIKSCKSLVRAWIQILVFLFILSFYAALWRLMKPFSFKSVLVLIFAYVNMGNVLWQMFGSFIRKEEKII